MYVNPAAAAVRHELANPRSHWARPGMRDLFRSYIFQYVHALSAETTYMFPVLMPIHTPDNQLAIILQQLGNPGSFWACPGLRDLVRGPIACYLYGFEPRNLDCAEPLDRHLCFSVSGKGLSIHHSGAIIPVQVTNLEEYRLVSVHRISTIIHVSVFSQQRYYHLTITEGEIRGDRSNGAGVVTMPRSTPLHLKAVAMEIRSWRPESYPISDDRTFQRDGQRFYRGDESHEIPTGANPYYEAGVWYNLDSVGIWSRNKGGVTQHLVGPYTWI